MKHLSLEDAFGTDVTIAEVDSNLAEDHAAFLQADQQLTAGQAAGDVAVSAAETLGQFSEQLTASPTLSSPVVAAMEYTVESICAQLGRNKAFKKEVYEATGEQRLQLVQEGIADRAKDIWLALVRFLERMSDFLTHYFEKFALYLGNHAKGAKKLATEAKALIASKGKLTLHDLNAEHQKVKIAHAWGGFLQTFADDYRTKFFTTEYIWIGGEGLFTERFRKMLSDLKALAAKRHQKASKLPNDLTKLFSDAAQENPNGIDLADLAHELATNLYKDSDELYGHIGAEKENSSYSYYLDTLKKAGFGEADPHLKLTYVTRAINSMYALVSGELFDQVDIQAPTLSLNEISNIDGPVSEAVSQLNAVQSQILDFKKFAQQVEALSRKEIKHDTMQAGLKNYASAISHYFSKLTVRSAREEMNRLIQASRIATNYAGLSLNKYKHLPNK